MTKFTSDDGETIEYPDGVLEGLMERRMSGCICSGAPGQNNTWDYHSDYCPVYMVGKIEELEAMIHEAREVYAGMEGFVPETAPEGYCLRIIEQMYAALIGESER